MKKIVINILIGLICFTQLIASPAAINFNNLPKDKNFEELLIAFENAYNSIKYSDFQNKDLKKDDLVAAKNFYEYLNKKKKTNYDEDLLKLLVMRCLYNYDEISSTEVEEAFSKIDKKYSKNAEHHWIYGNYLVSQGKTTAGRKELEKYMKMKDFLLGYIFVGDYAYSYLVSSMPLNAYYVLTNGGSIQEEAVPDQYLLNIIKGNIKESSADKTYTSEQVWKVSQEKDDDVFIYSTMLGISVPSKLEWGLHLEPFTKEHPALCFLKPDFVLEGRKITISVALMVYPESLYQENIKQKLLNSLGIIKEEKIEINAKQFEKYTFENLSQYQDIRKGARGYLYTAKIPPQQYSGTKCEHEIDYSKIKVESESGTGYFITTPAQKRLDEPVEVLIIVDSCNALKDETIKLLDDFFSKAVFE